MRPNSFYYAIFCALWQLSCGDLLSTRQAEPLPAVIVATQEQVDTLQVVANHYIVLFKSLPGLEQAQFTNYRSETMYFSGFLNDKYHYDAGIKDIRMISAVTLPSLAEEMVTPLESLGWQQAKHPPTGIITEVRFANNELAAAHLQRWQERGEIYFAEPVYIGLTRDMHDETEEEEPAAGITLQGYAEVHAEYNTYQTTASEDYWWHEKINLADAFNTIAQNKDEIDQTSGQKIYHSYDYVSGTATNQTIVAVFDSGIDYEHPALRGRMFQFSDYGDTKPDLACGNDLNGCNTTNPEKGKLGDGLARPWGTNIQWAQKLKRKEGGACPSGKDDNGNDIGFASCAHGTHVAGIIAADGKKKNSLGCAGAGVCPFCKIINIRVLSGVGPDGPENSRTGGVTDTSILNGLKYVYELWRNRIEVRIINASIGKFHRSRAVALLIKNLKEQSSVDGGSGVLVVGAAGNEDTMARTYPAALKDVLSVSATDGNNQKSQFSNFGMWVDIAAPGGSVESKICSTVPGKLYEDQAGTSMSTPVVAGVAGLILSVRNRVIDAFELENLLLYSADPQKLYPDEKKANEKQLAANNRNREYYFAKLEHTEHPVPLLGVGLLDADAALKGETNNTAATIIANDPDDRIDVASCGTLRMPVSALPLSLLLLLPLLLALRFRCRSSSI